MAASATDILSIESVKFQLQIDDGTELDNESELTSIIKRAVGFVSRITGVPLIDSSKVAWAGISSGATNPVVVPLKNIKTIESIKYWTTLDETRLAPTHEVVTTRIGRLEELPFGTVVHPPADGWPDACNSMLEFTCKVGVDIDEGNEDILTLVVLVARQIANGHPEIHLPKTLLINMTDFDTP